MRPATETLHDLSILLDWAEGAGENVNEHCYGLGDDYLEQSQQRQQLFDNALSPVTPASGFYQQQQQHGLEDEQQRHQRFVPATPASSLKRVLGEFDDDGDDCWSVRVEKLLHFVENYEFSQTPPAKTPKAAAIMERNPRSRSREAAIACTTHNSAVYTTSESYVANHEEEKKETTEGKYYTIRQGQQSSSTTAGTSPTTVSASDAPAAADDSSPASQPNISSSAGSPNYNLQQSPSTAVEVGHNGYTDGSAVEAKSSHDDNGQEEEEEEKTADQLWIEALEERHAARKWANQVRSAATKWIGEQEQLQQILQQQLQEQQQQQESMAAASQSATPRPGTGTATTTSGCANTSSCCNVEPNLRQDDDDDCLRQKVQALEEELQQARHRHLAIQEQLHCVIDYQQERIQYLEQELENYQQQLHQQKEQVAAEDDAPTASAQTAAVDDGERHPADYLEKRTHRSPQQQDGLTQPQEQQQAAPSLTNMEQPPHNRQEHDVVAAANTNASSPFLQHESHAERDRNDFDHNNNNNQSILISPESSSDPNPPLSLSSSSPPVLYDERKAQPQEHEQSRQQEQEPKSSQSRRGRRRFKTPEGHDVIQYSNGTTKEIHADGRTTILRFVNGDIQTSTCTSGGSPSTAYYFASTNVLRLVQADQGFTLWEFPNGQIEQHFHESGHKVVHFADGTRYQVVLSESSSE